VADEPASAVSKDISCCDGGWVSSRPLVGAHAHGRVQAGAGGRSARVLEAGPGRASTHLSVVGVGFGHCEDVVVGRM
jgi:hypothetical protein